MHKCDTCNCNYLPHTTFNFYIIDFQLNTDFSSQFCVFTVKSRACVTRRLVSQENAMKKSKDPSPFVRKTLGSNNYLTLIENIFRF